MRAHREPSFYIDALNPAFNTLDRERTYLKDGKAIRERKPQAGHQGPHIDDMERMAGEGYRYITVVDTAGHTIRHVLTSAAADMDPTGPLATHMKAKARALGWFRLAACPCALLRTGEMIDDHFVDKSLIGAQPCDPGTYGLNKPCSHALAEKAARQAVNAAAQAKYFEPGAAEKMIAAQQQHTADIVAALRDVMAPVAELAKAGASPKGGK